MPRWPKNVKAVRSGEAVAAPIVNRPTRTLQERTDYLKDRLDASELGNALFDFDAAISSDVQEGQPVFWNPDEARYELALAGASVDATSGVYVPTPATDCVGFLFKKTAPTVGDIVIWGLVPLAAISTAAGSPVATGRYYLSAVEAGHIVQQRPAITTPVCSVFGPKDDCTDVPLVFVYPQLRDFMSDHQHYRFELVCEPAGVTVPPTEGEVHVITDADATLPGWLPADHESFDGKAPARAAFGYNMAAQPALDRNWPPVPLQAVAVLWDKGQDRLGATEVPMGKDGRVVCDANGIWWMSDCYGDVPWPTSFDNDPEFLSSLSLSSSSTSSDAPPECPRTEVMRVSVVYLRWLIGADRAVVTSLQPAEDSPLFFHNCDGDDAVTGDLFAGLALEFFLDADEAYGGQVFKELVPGLKFRRGWVAEGIIAGSDKVVLTSSHQRRETVGDVNTPLVHQGLVVVDVNVSPIDQELAPQIVRLSDAVERLYKDVPYIGFPEGRDATIRLRFNIPPAGLPTSPQIKLRAVLFGLGPAATALPVMDLSYSRLARPSEDIPTDLPASEVVLDFLTDVTVDAAQAVEVETEAFTVVAGDTLLVTISRAADSGYLGEVGVIRIGAVIVAGE